MTIQMDAIASASSASWYHSGTPKLSCKQCLCIYKAPCLARACWAQPKPVVLRRADAGFAFLQNALSALCSILHLDDTAVNTESNLRYVILQKNLYKLGIPIDLFVEHKKDIDDLVNRRNGIAHGNAHAGISNMDFSNWESKVQRILSDITRLLYDYANHQRYLKDLSSNDE